MADEVRKTSSAVDSMAQNWPLIDALLGGTMAMRAKGEAYLPRWPNEEKESFDTRCKVATLFPAYERTVEVLSAKPFSKPLAVGDDVPSRIAAWCEDIDLQGRKLHVFAADLCTEALSHGLSGILVEYPEVRRVDAADTRAFTQAEEAALGVRPYFVQIHPQQLLGWRCERRSGRWILTQLRFIEMVSEPDGEFGIRLIEQVRVLEPGIWRTYRKRDRADAAGNFWTEESSGLTSLKEIPFVPIYGKRKAFMIGAPPLREIAFLNCKHWQSQSDQDTILHVARVPVLILTGIDENQTLTVGASCAIRMPAGADAKYVEHGGSGISSGRESISDIEDQMRQAGAELLIVQPGNKSVPQTLADNEPGKCALQRIAEDLEDAIDQALQLMAEWVGEAGGGHVELYKDFGAMTLAEASSELLLKATTAGKLSDQTFFAELKRRGQLSPDADWDDEKQRIEEQGPRLGEMASEVA